MMLVAGLLGNAGSKAGPEARDRRAYEGSLHGSFEKSGAHDVDPQRIPSH